MDANVADAKTLPIQSSMKRKSSAAKVVLGNNCTVKVYPVLNYITFISVFTIGLENSVLPKRRLYCPPTTFSTKTEIITRGEF